MNTIDVRDDLRLSGQVTRFHTQPRIREQSVGEHSWQLCRLILTICPQRSATLLPHAVIHDCGENGSGDPPYPVKKENPVLKKELDRIEGNSLGNQLAYWHVRSVPDLSEEDHHLFKILEMIEVWEWGLEEEMRGNKFARVVSERGWSGFVSMVQELRDEFLILRIKEYTTKRKEIWNVE